MNNTSVHPYVILLVLTCINALANAIGELNSEVETIKIIC